MKKDTTKTNKAEKKANGTAKGLMTETKGYCFQRWNSSLLEIGQIFDATTR